MALCCLINWLIDWCVCNTPLYTMWTIAAYSTKQFRLSLFLSSRQSAVLICYLLEGRGNSIIEVFKNNTVEVSMKGCSKNGWLAASGNTALLIVIICLVHSAQPAWHWIWKQRLPHSWHATHSVWETDGNLVLTKSATRTPHASHHPSNVRHFQFTITCAMKGFQTRNTTELIIQPQFKLQWQNLWKVQMWTWTKNTNVFIF